MGSAFGFCDWQDIDELWECGFDEEVLEIKKRIV